MKPKVFNRHRFVPPLNNLVSIERGTPWGNEFVIGVDGTREEVIEKFRIKVESDEEMIRSIKRELKGKNLVCCCKPKSCHGDILLEIANS